MWPALTLKKTKRMTTDSKPERSKCHFCAYKFTRYSYAKPVAVCRKFDKPANVVGCLDFRSKQTVVRQTLDFLKRTAIKK